MFNLLPAILPFSCLPVWLIQIYCFVKVVWHKASHWVRSKISCFFVWFFFFFFLWAYTNFFRKMSRDRNSHGPDTSRATTASPKSSFTSPLRVGVAVVGRRNAVWTTSKSGRSCPCHNCSWWSPAEKTGRGSLLNRPSWPPGDPIGQGSELNWTLKIEWRVLWQWQWLVNCHQSRLPRFLFVI